MSVDQFLLSADTTDLNYPDVRPTLDLNFARTKTLDPRITFTRASGGSYVGADGLIKYAGVNEARFDHDPETGESLGLLIEEQRSNLLNDSQNFLSSSWSSGTGAIARSTISPSTIISPEGTTNTFKLTEDTSMGTHIIGKGVTTFTLGTIFINSVFVKSAERTRVTVGAAADSKGRIFDLVNGTTFGTSSGVPGWTGLPDSDCGIIPYENGWFRIWTKHTSTNNPGNALYDRFNLFLTKDSIASYQGDGTSGVYLWGAQLEVGSSPTSYIPTQGSTRTRQPDSAIITGKNFSDFYRQDEGTVFADANGSGPLIVTRATAVPTDRIQLAGISAVVVSGSVQAGFGNTTAAKRVLAYKANNINMAFDGVTGVNDTSCAIPSVDYATIGYFDFGGASRNNGAIKRITFWPQRLPDSTLKAITR